MAGVGAVLGGGRAERRSYWVGDGQAGRHAGPERGWSQDTAVRPHPRTRWEAAWPDLGCAAPSDLHLLLLPTSLATPVQDCAALQFKSSPTLVCKT